MRLRTPFLKCRGTDPGLIENPASWLTTACTKRSIDILRAPNRARVDCVGPWLPEPMQTATADTVEESLSLISTYSTAFLLMLERLKPNKRSHERIGGPGRTRTCNQTVMSGRL